jgi:hypothetical protein
MKKGRRETGKEGSVRDTKERNEIGKYKEKK